MQSVYILKFRATRMLNEFLNLGARNQQSGRLIRPLETEIKEQQKMSLKNPTY